MSKITMFFVYLIIGLLVLGILVFILAQVFGLSVDIPDQGQTTLKQYSTCVLAYCSAGGKDDNGLSSDEVRAVGCLKRDTLGPCEMSCEDVEEKIFSIVDKEKEGNAKGSFRDFVGRPHYCGREYSLQFDFNEVTFGNAVTLRSGQMDSMALSPKWVCKPLEIFGLNMDEALASVPFFGVAGISTADWAYNGQIFNMGVAPQNCLMLSKAQTDTATYANTIAFVASFFVGGPQTFAAGKVATQAAVSGMGRGVITKLAVGIPVASTSVKSILRSTITLPAKGGLRAWLSSGLVQGTVVSASGAAIKESNAFGLANLKTRGGCFTGFVFDKLDDKLPPNEGLLYTPIIGYDTGDEWKKVYPSAIYVDESFTESRSGLEKAECEFINPSKAFASRGLNDEEFSKKIEDFKKSYISSHASDYDGAKIDYEYQDVDGTTKTASRPLTKEEIDEILAVDAEDAALAEFGSEDPIVGFDLTLQPVYFSSFDFGNMISKCSFKTREDGEKVKYEVWSSPTYPGAGSLNERLKVGYDLKPDEELSFDYTDSSGKKKTIKLSQADIQSIGEFSMGNANGGTSTALDFLAGPAKDQITEEQKKNGDVRAQTNAFTFFGSCAYVTLARAGESTSSEPISEETTVQNPPETQGPIVTGLTLDYTGHNQDKKFSSGDTIELIGTASVASGSTKGVEVKISVVKEPLVLEGATAVVSDDGSFKVDYILSSGSGDYFFYANTEDYTKRDFTNSVQVSVE